MLRFVGLSLFVLNMLAFKALHESHAPHDWTYQFTLYAPIVGMFLFVLGTGPINQLISRSSLRILRRYWHELLAASVIFAALDLFIVGQRVSVSTVVNWAIAYSIMVAFVGATFLLNHWIVGPNEEDA